MQDSKNNTIVFVQGVPGEQRLLCRSWLSRFSCPFEPLHHRATWKCTCNQVQNEDDGVTRAPDEKKGS
jgi:hypothetical protein